MVQNIQKNNKILVDKNKKKGYISNIENLGMFPKKFIKLWECSQKG